MQQSILFIEIEIGTSVLSVLNFITIIVEENTNFLLVYFWTVKSSLEIKVIMLMDVISFLALNFRVFHFTFIFDILSICHIRHFIMRLVLPCLASRWLLFVVFLKKLNISYFLYAQYLYHSNFSSECLYLLFTRFLLQCYFQQILRYL